LHWLIQPEITRIHKQINDICTNKRQDLRLQVKRVHNKTWKSYIPNGNVESTVCLAIALRYFAAEVIMIYLLYSVLVIPNALNRFGLLLKLSIGLNISILTFQKIIPNKEFWPSNSKNDHKLDLTAVLEQLMLY
jgi:hypothetical protein